ncbi:S-adenosylmethionine:tRNA ribosyltransferase-isomerase [Rhodovulum sp. P5]|nr:S-adenosylmethionine:tRNA ribosyltransferase-isomerase [Rhodovulum sp. P5]
MKLSDFDFDLPEELIATRPARPRPAARLLVADGGLTRDAHVRDLPAFLRPGDRLVLNDTKVIPARLTGTRRRETPQGPVEARVEITLMEPAPDGRWRAMAKPLRKLKAGERIDFAPDFSAEVTDRGAEDVTLAFNCTGDAFDAALARVGAMPLPPYIAARRPADHQDLDDYQSVWAARAGPWPPRPHRCISMRRCWQSCPRRAWA